MTVDAMLAAIQPDSRPLTISRLWDLLPDGSESLKPVKKDARGRWVPVDPYDRSLDQWGTLQIAKLELKDAYIKRPGASALAIRESSGVLLVMAVLWLIYLSAIIYPWAPLRDNMGIAFVILAGLTLFLSRWLKVRKTLRLSMTESLPQRTRSTPYYPDPDNDPNQLSFKVEGEEGRSYKIEDVQVFTEKWGIGSASDFELPFFLTLKARHELVKIWRKRSDLQEDFEEVSKGDIRAIAGNENGKSYNPNDISMVELDKPFDLIAWIIFLVIVAASGLAMFGLAVFSTMTSNILSFLGLLTLTICFGLPAILTVGGLLTGTGMGMRPRVVEYPVYRVRVRLRGGGWTTLLKTERHALAVELYNLVSREVRRPSE